MSASPIRILVLHAKGIAHAELSEFLVVRLQINVIVLSDFDRQFTLCIRVKRKSNTESKFKKSFSLLFLTSEAFSTSGLDSPLKNLKITYSSKESKEAYWNLRNVFIRNGMDPYIVVVVVIAGIYSMRRHASSIRLGSILSCDEKAWDNFWNSL